jgi:hypothetical protein
MMAIKRLQCACSMTGVRRLRLSLATLRAKHRWTSEICGTGRIASSQIQLPRNQCFVCTQDKQGTQLRLALPCGAADPGGSSADAWLDLLTLDVTFFDDK